MAFSDDALALVKKVPKGRVTTYYDIAKALGRPGAVRAVGNALSRNPDLVRVPCHRVVRSDGTLGGYVLGEEKKAELLRSEGVEIRRGKVFGFDRRLAR